MALSKMAEPTPFPIDDELGDPTATMPPEDDVLEKVATGLDIASKILDFASIPAAFVPGLPEVLGIVKGGLSFFASLIGMKVDNDKAQVEISIIQNATARVKKCEASIDKQTADLEETLGLAKKSRDMATQSAKTLSELQDTLNKAFSHSLMHFDTVSTQLNQVLDNIETLKHEIIKSIDVAVARLEDADKRLSTQQIVSRLSTVCNFFFAEAKLTITLPLEQRVVKLEQTPGIFDFIKLSLYGTDGTGILTKLLDNIIDENLAIPDSNEDYLGFAVLSLLCYGVNVYAFMLLFQLQQHETLAQSYYDEGDLAKFNKYHLRIGTEFKEFSPGLIDDYSGAIAKVLSVLHRVFSKFDPESDQLKPFENSTTSYLNMRSHLWSVREKFTEQITPPKLDAALFFDFSPIETPANEWKTGSSVLYAIQLLGADAASSTIVGDWSNAWTLENLASPVVMVGTDLVNRTRIIFRKIDDGKPQIVAYMSNITMYLFNDVNRDLLNSAYEPNKRLALRNVKRYLDAKDINVNVLLEHNRRAIHGAAETNNWEVASELIKKGAYLDVQTDEGYTPLYIATKKGYYDFVSNLIAHGASANMTTTDPTHRLTALHAAALKGHAKLVKLFLNTKWVDVNAPTVEGFTPLHYAATFNREEAASVLLADKRVASNATSNELKLTPLHLAAVHNCDTVAQMLIDARGVDIGAKAVEGNTPLHFAAVQGSREVLQILLDKGANLSDKLSDNTTPLHMAAFNGDVVIVKKLLDKIKREDLDPVNSKFLTPLYLAYKNNNLSAAEKLIDHGADINIEPTEGKSLLHLAAEYGHLTAVKNLLNHGIAVTSEDNLHMSALNYAVNNNFIEIINELLKRGADPNFRVEGKPLVHTLVDKSEDDALNILKLFVIYNVNLNSVNTNEKSGNSFFQVVCEKGFLSIASYLYQHRVNINHINNAHKTALDLARENNHFEVVKFLESISNGNSKTRTRRDVNANYQFDEQELNLGSEISDQKKFLDSPANAVTRQQREVADEFSVAKQVASSAGSPSGLLNGAVESLVSTLKSLPAQLSSILSFTLDNSNGHSFAGQSALPSLHSVDLNSTLFLFDVLIRRYSTERYVNTLTHSVTPQEARVYALALVEQLQMAFDRWAQQSGAEQIELDWFDMYRTVERLAINEQYNKIEGLVHSTAREAFAHEKFDKNMIAKMVDKLIDSQFEMTVNGQKIKSNLADLHSFSGDNSARTVQKAGAGLVETNKHNLIQF